MFKLLTKLTGLKLAELEAETESLDSAVSSSNDKVEDHVELSSCCTCEVRHWSHGCYTLMHDSDPGSHEFALDAMLFFGSDGMVFSVFLELLSSDFVTLYAVYLHIHCAFFFW